MKGEENNWTPFLAGLESGRTLYMHEVKGAGEFVVFIVCYVTMAKDP